MRRIQAHGITVNGCFILGLDGHTPDIFEEVLDFALRGAAVRRADHGADARSPARRSTTGCCAKAASSQPGRWDLCTLFDVNFQPRGMTAQQLRKACTG